MVITSIYTVFIIVMNTVVQFFVSKKDIKLYTIIWTRDLISAAVFIYIGLYWQLWIVAWQFVLTYTGYLCWKYEHETGININQIQLVIILLNMKKGERITVVQKCGNCNESVSHTVTCQTIDEGYENRLYICDNCNHQETLEVEHRVTLHDKIRHGKNS